jgi:hypothetical protein
VRQDPLDRDAAVEALEPSLLGEKHFGHAAARDAPQQHVLAEPNPPGAGHGPLSYQAIAVGPGAEWCGFSSPALAGVRPPVS